MFKVTLSSSHTHIFFPNTLKSMFIRKSLICYWYGKYSYSSSCKLQSPSPAPSLCLVPSFCTSACSICVHVWDLHYLFLGLISVLCWQRNSLLNQQNQPNLPGTAYSLFWRLREVGGVLEINLLLFWHFTFGLNSCCLLWAFPQNCSCEVSSLQAFF